MTFRCGERQPPVAVLRGRACSSLSPATPRCLAARAWWRPPLPRSVSARIACRSIGVRSSATDPRPATPTRRSGSHSSSANGHRFPSSQASTATAWPKSGKEAVIEAKRRSLLICYFLPVSSFVLLCHALFRGRTCRGLACVGTVALAERGWLETGLVTAPGTISVLAGFRFPRGGDLGRGSLVPAVRAVLPGC